MALEGPLKELHIQDVFQLLDLGRKSGVLRVTSELRQTAGDGLLRPGRRGGRRASAATRSRSGPAWCGPGKITAADLDRARGMQTAGDGRRLGDILVDLGVITRRELDRQLKAQIEEAVFELLRWSEGYFRFEEGSPCARGGGVAGALSDRGAADGGGAADRRVVAHRLEGVAPPAGAAAAAARRSRAADPLDLVPFEWEVLAAVDGPRDLHALAEVLGRSEFEVARTVYGLTNAGVVVLDDPAHPGEEAEPGRDLAALLVPAREALAPRPLRDRPPGRSRSCSAPIR